MYTCQITKNKKKKGSIKPATFLLCTLLKFPHLISHKQDIQLNAARMQVWTKGVPRYTLIDKRSLIYWKVCGCKWIQDFVFISPEVSYHSVWLQQTKLPIDFPSVTNAGWKSAGDCEIPSPVYGYLQILYLHPNMLGLGGCYNCKIHFLGVNSQHPCWVML